jgi:hypothetical protein
VARVFPGDIDEHRLARPRPVLDLFEFAPGVLPFDLYLQKQNRLQRATDVDTAGLCPADLIFSGSTSSRDRIRTDQDSPTAPSSDTSVACDGARRYGAARLGDVEPVQTPNSTVSATRPVAIQYVKQLTFPSGLIIDVLA